MNVNRFRYGKENIIQVYLNKREYHDNKIQEKIDKLKEDENTKIVIFVSGEMETVPQIKKMISFQQKYSKV